MESGQDMGMATLPHSLEAEQAVLGAIMIDAGAMGVIDEAGLQEADFFHSHHRRLFRALAAMDSRQQPVDVLTVSETLGDDLEDAGGNAFLLELCQNTPSSANVGAYAQIVRDRARSRHWLATLAQAQAFFFDRLCKDPVAQAETLLAGLDGGSGDAAFVTLRQALKDRLLYLENKFENPGLHGLQTGYHNIDHRLGGVYPADLWIVAGRPGMGKTAYMLNVMRQVALQRREGAILSFSLEMMNGSLVERLLAAQGRIKKDLLRSARVFSHEESATRLTVAMQQLMDLDLLLCDKPGLTARDIRALSLAQKRRQPVRLVTVDYLGLIDYEGRERSTADQIAVITKTLKRLARELGCPVMLLCQLNREVDKRANKRPLMSDLRDSGAIEQDADIIQFLYRDEYYNKDNSQWPGQVEVISEKLREGEPGTDYLTFSGAYQLMESNSSYDRPVVDDDFK